jgi:hypothetical protein
LIEEKKFFLLDLGYVATNDHAPGKLSIRASQRSPVHPGPEALRRVLVPNENLDVVYFLTANRTGQG